MAQKNNLRKSRESALPAVKVKGIINQKELFPARTGNHKNNFKPSI
jgi:hypothetical protein